MQKNIFHPLFQENHTIYHHILSTTLLTLSAIHVVLGGSQLIMAATTSDNSIVSTSSASLSLPALSTDKYYTYDTDIRPNLSPTRDAWNNFLGLKWQRGSWGDWIDATGKEFGQSTVGAVPYASFAVPKLDTYTSDVTSLVKRWMTNGQNKGFYLRMKNSAFPIIFAGRTHTLIDARPALFVETDKGVFTLEAQSNATWVLSTYKPASTSGKFFLDGQSPSVLRFDISNVSGNVTSARLKVTAIDQTIGSTSAKTVIDIFEFDPPIANKPITVPQPPVITGSTIPPVSTGSTLPPIVLTGGQSPTPIITIPGVPTNVVATAGLNAATVSFMPPTISGGTPITSYVITGLPGNITTSGTKSPITISGLTAGTTYTFKVRAMNAKGSGGDSVSSNSITIAPVNPTPTPTPSPTPIPSGTTVPGVPTGVTAVPGGNTANISFVAPGNTGGLPITSYIATSSPGNITASGTKSPIYMAGLTSNVKYTFTVKAVNVKGSSVASAPSSAVVVLSQTKPIDNSGSNIVPPTRPVPAASPDIVQYLTHDGDMVGSVLNSSAPTKYMWNHVLGFPWKRGSWGDWLDATGKEYGKTTTGAVPYALFQVTKLDTFTSDVTPLVAKWMNNGKNKGFYIRMENNPFPVIFAGRSYPIAESRPSLVVVTDKGSYSLGARANASWSISTYMPGGGSNKFTLDGQGPSIVQFDLTPVKGTVKSAKLSITAISQGIGSTTGKGVVKIFEADPPTFIVPTRNPPKVKGIAATLGSFKDLKSHPDVLISADFSGNNWPDRGFAHGVQKYLNPDTSTVYACSKMVAKSNQSLDIRADVSKGTGENGKVDVAYPELYSQYSLYLEKNFGSNVDSIKFPAMGVQYGYWNPIGYWQQTTGNGGSRGSGLKLWNYKLKRWEYQGHSVRILVGQKPADNSAYKELHGLAFYPYNLDQIEPFPAGENFPYVAIEKEKWTTFDLHVKQNSIIGPYDANGNGQAVKDGVLEAWINGQLVFKRDDFRWRRHPDFGVQGLWLDVYHGGKLPAPYDIGYCIDRVTVSKKYIGPR